MFAIRPRRALGVTAAVAVASLVAAVLLLAVLSTSTYAQQPGPKNESDCVNSMSCERSPPRIATSSGSQWRVEVVIFVAAAAVAGIGYRVVVTRIARRS